MSILDFVMLYNRIVEVFLAVGMFIFLQSHSDFLVCGELHYTNSSSRSQKQTPSTAKTGSKGTTKTSKNSSDFGSSISSISPTKSKVATTDSSSMGALASEFSDKSAEKPPVAPSTADISSLPVDRSEETLSSRELSQSSPSSQSSSASATPSS